MKLKINGSQFHYGSITTVLAVTGIAVGATCLNSTMVRLQQQNLKFVNFVWIMSQFHYGSITTPQYRTESGIVIDVSIPLWFDYN